VTEPHQWSLIIVSRAERELKGLPPRDQARIRTVVDRLAVDPRRGDVTKLHGLDDELRLRVGVWRVRFRLDRPSRTLVVLSVRHRREAYRA